MTVPLLPKSLFGRLVVAQIAYGAIVVLAFALIAEYTHGRFHYKATQHQARDWATRHVASHPVLKGDAGTMDAALVRLGDGHPGIEPYLIGDDGRILAASVSRDRIRRPVFDMATVRAWLDGSGGLPMMVADPVQPERRRIFSAAPLGDGGRKYLVLLLQVPDTEGFLAAYTGFLLSDSLKLALGVMLPALATAVLLLFMILKPIRRIKRTLSSLERKQLDLGVRDIVIGPRRPVSELDQVSCDVEAMARKIADLLQRFKDDESSLRELFATLSHDLRTPLAIVKGTLGSLTTRTSSHPDGEIRALVRGAVMQVQYLERMLDKQFELANLQRPDYGIEEEPVYIADLIHDVVLKFAARANAHALDLKFIGDPLANFRVSADVMLIERVLDNLIDNAIRHAKGATRVMLEVHAAPDDVQVCVWDDGPGLPQALEAWLQGQTLTRPPRSRTDTSGSGLGFRIVLRILELHSSRLIVSRADRRGTCLSFRLFRYDGA